MSPSFKTQARWFLRQMRPLLPAYVLGVFLILLTSLLFLLDPLLLKWMIDSVLPKKNVHLLLYAAAGFLGLYITRLTLFSLAELVNFRTVQNLVFRMRLGILEKMNLLSADYHESNAVGERLYRLEQDVDQVAEVGSSLLPYILQTAFNSVFVMATMFTLDFKLTSLVLPLIPVFFVFRGKFEKPLRRAADSTQDKAVKESSFLQEHLASVIQVQLLHQEGVQAEAFKKFAADRIRAINRRQLVEITFSTCFMAIVSLGMITILGYGGYQVFIGVLTLGGMVAFYSYMAHLFDPLRAAVEIYSQLNRLGTNIRRILEVTEMAPSVPEYPKALSFPASLRGRIEMKNVCFSYQDALPVLESVDLKLEPGEKVALVGVSGCGKSTIAKLIARLYDVKSGNVLIDGIDVRRVTLASLRTKICYLLQAAVIFDRTIKENLFLANPSATPQDLQRAVEIADLDNLLRRLPLGLDTPVGPGGNALSGGERQRLALARAVLQNPCVLLLDEATSALDTPSERRVLMNLARHFCDRTIVFVSHRIAALNWVDRIVVLNRGTIQEQGKHDELIRGGGLYSQLHSVPAFTNAQTAALFPTDI